MKESQENNETDGYPIRTESLWSKWELRLISTFCAIYTKLIQATLLYLLITPIRLIPHLEISQEWIEKNITLITMSRHELKFGRYPVPISSQNFLSWRYPVTIGTQKKFSVPIRTQNFCSDLSSVPKIFYPAISRYPSARPIKIILSNLTVFRKDDLNLNQI